MLMKTGREGIGWLTAVAVGTVGAVLSFVHVLHVVKEFPEGALAILSGGLLPIFVSLVIVGAAVWIANRPWVAVSPRPFIVWFSVSLFFGVGLSFLLLVYQLTEGVTLIDPLYVVAMFATYGGGFGLLLGWYDVQRRVEQARQERKADRLEEFAGIVSHDLRNPLHVASARLELAKEESESDHLDAVGDALDRMEALIEDLLTLAREGESISDPEPVSLEQLCSESWTNVATGEASVSVEVSRSIRADRQRLAQLLENLLRNAIQHGGEDVSIEIGDLPDGFYVSDDGPGIPDSERESVFDSGYSTSGQGVGIGLSIVQQICQAHDWGIRVTDGKSGGARFEITGVEFASE